nr:unnamed protein product [Spirometra erinaceieuropaei]
MVKKRKLYIKFDESKRVDYLTGFHKRKVQRREKAKQENEKLLKDEIKKVKNAYREDLLQKMRSTNLPNFLADDLQETEFRKHKNGVGNKDTRHDVPVDSDQGNGHDVNCA